MQVLLDSISSYDHTEDVSSCPGASLLILRLKIPKDLLGIYTNIVQKFRWEERGNRGLGARNEHSAGQIFLANAK